MMSSPQPYQIHVPDDKIHRLERKLALADFPNDAPDSDGTSWDRGPPVSEIRRLVKVWQEGYSWRRAESMLNKLPQFMIPITVDSLDHSYDIHFVHKKSTREDAIPLLFLHGWPGSFIEVTKLIDTLVAGDGEDEPVFHIVAPSLVDFGFSSASTVSLRERHSKDSTISTAVKAANNSQCHAERVPVHAPRRGLSQVDVEPWLRPLR